MILAFPLQSCSLRRMHTTLIAAVDYNQSILAFIGFLVLLTPQVLAYLAGRRAASDNESTNRIVRDLAPVVRYF